MRTQQEVENALRQVNLVVDEATETNDDFCLVTGKVAQRILSWTLKQEQGESFEQLLSRLALLEN